MAEHYHPRMSSEQADILRRWHEESHAALRARLPADISFMGLELHVPEDVFPVPDSAAGDPYHQAVEKEVRPSLRVLDMGTGCGKTDLIYRHYNALPAAEKQWVRNQLFGTVGLRSDPPVVVSQALVEALKDYKRRRRL